MLVVFLFGGVLGYYLRHYVARLRRIGVEEKVERMILDAKRSAQTLIDEAKATIAIEENKIDQERKDLRQEDKDTKERNTKIEERLLLREDDIRVREESLRNDVEQLHKKEDALRELKDSLEVKAKSLVEEQERLSGLSRDQIKALLIKNVESESEQDILSRMYKLSREGESRLESKAKDILTNIIYRLANTEVASFTTSTVTIDDQEIKGKIIGKEGRNIKTFERIAGVDVLVDESPNTIVISCFDPVRRAIATNALEMLIKDGRIQPAKIEEFLEKAKKDIGSFMKKKGEEAVFECSLVGIPDALVPLIGRLYFRTSYGQNVLNHSIEMAHIAGMLASELGGDVHVARAGALLHDIGKAVDHEIQGTHVEIGRKILKKYNVNERIIQAMQAHHEEYPYETLESILVQVADAISGGRPGARRDTVERYIERLSQLEALAMAFSGIEKVYALQAGREIRVFVTPALVSDLQARDLARSIAIRIEEELRYPGEIKINVIRESRVIEFAR